MLKFNDGVNINTSAPIRKLHLYDGWYVVGKGMSIPCSDEQEADEIIENMKASH